MSRTQFIDGDDRLVRRYEYDDETVIVADLGVGDGDASVDVVDGTAIVVIDDGEDTVQTEFDLPSGGRAEAFIKNGIVTIEVAQ